MINLYHLRVDSDAKRRVIIESFCCIHVKPVENFLGQVFFTNCPFLSEQHIFESGASNNRENKNCLGSMIGFQKV